MIAYRRGRLEIQDCAIALFPSAPDLESYINRMHWLIRLRREIELRDELSANAVSKLRAKLEQMQAASRPAPANVLQRRRAFTPRIPASLNQG